MKCLTALVAKFAALIVCFSGNCNAGIILTNVGNALVIDIENSVIFDVASSATTSRPGFNLPGAIDVAGSGGYSLTYDPATAPTLLGTSFVAGEPDVALIRGRFDLEVLFFSRENN